MNTENQRCEGVVFSDRAYQDIKTETYDKDPVETGGILLGHILPTGHWVVVEVIPPGDNSTHQYAYFEYNEQFVNRVANQIADKYETKLQLLGLWHRHPGSMDFFSGTDDGTNKKFAEINPAYGAISGLVNIDPEFRMTMYHVASPLKYNKVETFFGDDIIPEELLKLKQGVTIEEIDAIKKPKKRQQQPASNPASDPAPKQQRQTSGSEKTRSATPKRETNDKPQVIIQTPDTFATVAKAHPVAFFCLIAFIVVVIGVSVYLVKDTEKAEAVAETAKTEAAAKEAELVQEELKRINDINAKYSAKSDKVSELENWKKALQALDLKYDENKKARDNRIAVIDEIISDLNTKTDEERRKLKKYEEEKIGQICDRYNTEKNKSAAGLESYLAELNILKRTIKYADSRKLDNVIARVKGDITEKKKQEYSKKHKDSSTVANQEEPTPEPTRNESTAPAGKVEDKQKECAVEFQQINSIAECKDYTDEKKTSKQLENCIDKLKQKLAKTNCDNNKQTITTQIGLIGNAKKLAKAKEDFAKQQEKKAEEERCRNLAKEKKYEEAKTYYTSWRSADEPKGEDRKNNEKILTDVLTALTNGKCGETQVYEEVQKLQLNTNANILHNTLESRCDCKAYKTLEWIKRKTFDDDVLKKCKKQCGNK